MPISIRTRGSVRILELSGDFAVGIQLSKPVDLHGRPLDDLRQSLEDQLVQGHTRLLLDMRKVKFIDSSGLGELVACKKKTSQRGGDIKILRPAGKVRELLVLTLLTEMFEIFDDEAEAVDSFGPEAARG